MTLDALFQTLEQIMKQKENSLVDIISFTK